MKKYILLLVSVFAFGQAPDQMVSFTAAQSLGFSLKAGQSHVTSNQCMTKSEALAKYNLKASEMVSYVDNQLVPRSVWVIGNVTIYSYTFSNTGYSSTQSACANPNSGMILYSIQSFITSSATMYTDAELTSPFNGAGKFWRSGTNIWIIESNGNVSGGYGC